MPQYVSLSSSAFVDIQLRDAGKRRAGHTGAACSVQMHFQTIYSTSTKQGAPSTNKFMSVNTNVPAKAASCKLAPDLVASGLSAACLAAYTTKMTTAEPVRTLKYMGNSFAWRLPKVRRGRFLNATYKHTNRFCSVLCGASRTVPAEAIGRP